MNQSLIEVTNAEDAPAILQEYGVCIVKSLLDERECSNIVEGMKNSFEYLTSEWEVPFKFSNRKSWSSLEQLQPIRYMLYQHWGLGHAQFVWDVRCNPKIINAFATLWGTNDLLVSFDGISFHLPPEISHQTNAWQVGNNFHTDQSFLMDKFDCIQGHVNGYDTNEGDATLVVLTGSHKYHAEYGRIHNRNDPRHYASVRDYSWFLSKGCLEHRITCPKGSLVLWDSRTIHYGSGPLESRPTPNYRAIVYVCYTPRSKITETNRQKKIHYFENKMMTNHWPHSPEPFGNNYSAGGVKVKALPPPVIEKQYLTLAGYNPDELT